MSLIEIKTTADGSPTLLNTEFGSTYHSDHGAIQESMHVFINAGLHRSLKICDTPIRVLEMGFGSGLNALLSLIYVEGTHFSVEYTALEKYPICEELIDRFSDRLDEELRSDFGAIHQTLWDEFIPVSPNFQLNKLQVDLTEVTGLGPFDLVYYDAFEPRTQPELWTLEIFQKLADWMVKGGTFVTYCAKGQVRRDLQVAGFQVERLMGPPGKREMIRAIKR